MKLIIAFNLFYLVEKMITLKYDKFTFLIESFLGLEKSFLSKTVISLGLYSQTETTTQIARETQPLLKNVKDLNELVTFKENLAYLLSVQKNNLDVYANLHNNYFKTMPGRKLYNLPPQGNFKYNWTDSLGNLNTTSESFLDSRQKIEFLEKGCTISDNIEFLSFLKKNESILQETYGLIYNFNYMFITNVFQDHIQFWELIIASSYIYLYSFMVTVFPYILVNLILVNFFFLLLFIFKVFKNKNVLFL